MRSGTIPNLATSPASPTARRPISPRLPSSSRRRKSVTAPRAQLVQDPRLLLLVHLLDQQRCFRLTGRAAYRAVCGPTQDCDNEREEEPARFEMDVVLVVQRTQRAAAVLACGSVIAAVSCNSPDDDCTSVSNRTLHPCQQRSIAMTRCTHTRTQTRGTARALWL